MATYNELASIAQSDTAAWASFSEKVKVACVVWAANVQANGASTTLQKAFAVKVASNPAGYMEQVRNLIIAMNKTVTTIQILGAADVNIQTNVNTACDFFAANGG